MGGGRGCVQSILLVFALLRASLCLAFPLDTVPPESLRAVVVTIDGIRKSEFEQWNEALTGWIAGNGAYVSDVVNLTRGVTDPNHAILWGCGDPNQCRNLEGNPDYPMHFELLRSQRGLPASSVFFATGKSHLIETDMCSDHPHYGCAYRATTLWVVSPPPSEYGSLSYYQGPDSLIMKRAVEYLDTNDVRWAGINLSEYDMLAHPIGMYGCAADTACYWAKLEEVYREAERLVIEVLWPFLQSHSRYAGRTVLVVATDHGRHQDGVSIGFVDHGHGWLPDWSGCEMNCAGCRDTWAMFAGPGIQRGTRATGTYNLEDIGPTIRHLLGFHNPFETGVPIDEILVTSPATSVAADGRAPAVFFVEPNRPNPFPGSTTIRFRMPRPGAAELTVYDIRGRVVHHERRGEFGVGAQSFLWDGRDDGGLETPPGVYFCTVLAADGMQSRKMTKLR